MMSARIKTATCWLITSASAQEHKSAMSKLSQEANFLLEKNIQTTNPASEERTKIRKDFSSSSGRRKMLHLALMDLTLLLLLATTISGSSIRVAVDTAQSGAVSPKELLAGAERAHQMGSSIVTTRNQQRSSSSSQAGEQHRKLVEQRRKAAIDDDRDPHVVRIPQRKGVKLERALVRQLSDLIMNNEPATIQQKLASEQIDGQLMAETNRLLLESIGGNGGDEDAKVSAIKLTKKTGATGGAQRNKLLEAASEKSLSLADLASGDDSSDGATNEDDADLEEDDAEQQQLQLQEQDDDSDFLTTANSNRVSEKKRRHMADEAPASPDQAWPRSEPSGGAVILGESTSDMQQSDEPAGRGGEFIEDQQQENQQQFSSNEEQQLREQQQQQQQQQSVTCSPDYEDQAAAFEHENFNLSELSNETFINNNNNNSSNLTLEQRQQLLGSADASGMLQFQHNNLTGGGGSIGGQQQAGMIGQCVPSSNRMIEVITMVIAPILFSIIIIVGLLGNIIVMLVILEDRKLERELTPTNLLILDLSLADLSFIIFCIPFTGWDYAVGHWVFGSLWCKFNQYLIVVCALSSIYTLVLMSCDRFMAIVYPIECISYRTSKNMLQAIIIKWIVILLIASPTILVHGLVDSPYGPDQYNCRFLSDQFNPLHFQLSFFITSYFLPLVLIFFLYLSLLRRLWCGQKPHGHKESTKMLESKKKVTWLVASIVLVFAACWFPIQIMLILMRLKTHKITATYVAIQVFAHTLGYMNSCINPIVYAFASDTFNQSFKKSRLGRLCLTYLCCQKATQAHLNNNNNNNNNNHHNNNNTTHIRHFNQTSTNNGHHETLAGSNNHLMAVVDAAHDGRRTGATRNSLQITTTNAGGTFALGSSRSNASLGNILAPAQPRGLGLQSGTSKADVMLEDCVRAKSPQAGATLALEPRDRPTIKSPPFALQARISTSSSANQLERRRDDPGTAAAAAAAVAGDADEKQTSQQQQAQQVVVAKQQLVARMVNSSGAAGSHSIGQVSHDCQPGELTHHNCDVDGVDLGGTR